MKSLFKMTGWVLACLIISAVTAAGCLAAIPRYSTDPNDFVSSGAQYFWVNGQPFAFTGFNTRGICHYGYKDILYWSNHSDRTTNLNHMVNVGSKVARVFVSCDQIDKYETGDRLDVVLGEAAARNIRLIVSLTDFYHTGLSPQGDGQYYVSSGGWTILGEDFFQGGYQNNYLPQVQYLVNRFKNDPVVFCWQLGNELKTQYGDWRDILPFSQAVTTAIRAIDQNHMVSLGSAGQSYLGLNWSDTVTLYQLFDFITIHPYNGEDWQDDSDVADYLGLPLVVSEAGFGSSSYDDRPAHTDADIAKWVSRGARGYMNWGLMATTYDNGDGDREFGIDPVFHEDDWNAYKTVYSFWSAELANAEPPLPPAPQNVQASDGSWPDRIEITWDEAYGATEYIVMRAETVDGARTFVSAWQSGRVFQDTTVNRGQTYFYWVRPRNTTGQGPISDYDPGYANGAPAVTVTQAKDYPNGTELYITGGVVSGAFNSEFYLQDGKLGGISVMYNGTVNEGDQVNVLGIIVTYPDGERKLPAMQVIPQ